MVISDAFMTSTHIVLLFLTYRHFLGNIRWLGLAGLWLGISATFQPAVAATPKANISDPLAMFHQIQRSAPSRQF